MRTGLPSLNQNRLSLKTRSSSSQTPTAADERRPPLFHRSVIHPAANVAEDLRGAAERRFEKVTANTLLAVLAARGCLPLCSRE